MEKFVCIFKALSEEIRLRIVLLLMHGELCVCELMEAFGEPQSKVSRHLAYLKRSGLVKSRRVGAWMHYSISDSLNETALAQLKLLQKSLSKQPALKRDLANMKVIKRAELCERQKTPEGKSNKGKKK